MLSVKSSLCALAFAAAVHPAAAQDLTFVDNKPQLVFSDEEMGQTLYLFMRRKSPENIVTVGNALLDDATGAVCEWIVQGEQEAGTGGRNKYTGMKFIYQNCVSGTEVPAGWQFADSEATQELEKIDIGQELGSLRKYTQWKDGDEKIVEVSKQQSKNNPYLLSYQYRFWDLAKGEICLSSSEGMLDVEGEFKPFLKRDGGCYPIDEKRPYVQQFLYEHAFGKS